MAAQALKRSDFKETYAVHAALRYALRTKLFAKDAGAKKAAERLLKRMESDRSIYGRQCKMIRLMSKGASIARLRRGLNCSRRTVFRYFIDLEKAGVDITLDASRYSVSKDHVKLVT